jgi:DNA-binding SARP family transcriptional activator
MSLMLRVLGPVELLRDGDRMSLGPPKRRIMLVTLALEANRVVSLARLTQAVWPSAAPPSAVANLRSHAAALRQALGDRLVAGSGGYALALEPHEFDADEFLRLSQEGRRALLAGEPAATIHLGAALACWRGPAADGLEAGSAVDTSLRGLDEQRLDVFEDHIAAQHAGALYLDTIPQLRAHLAEHPLRERAWSLLMVALYRAGNVAAALAAYAEARAYLGDQLGIEPGPDLSALHRSILVRDVRLGRSAPVDTLPRSARFRANRGPSYAWRASS